jgi:DNA polymerase lambda
MRKKVKPALMSPFEYAVKLQDAIPPSRTLKFLKGKALFYVSGDMQYAGAKTRGRMEFVSSSVFPL